MSHRTYVSKTVAGRYIWACVCGDQAPNAFYWKLAASFHANKHVEKAAKA